MKPTYPLPEPTIVWTRFFELVAVPRPSKDEGAAIDYLEKWANQLGFDARRDAANNLLVHVPATGGTSGSGSSAASVMLQCHVDIVSVTAAGASGADASKGLIPTTRGDLDPANSKRLKPSNHGDWIMAEQTTLGADNGIGVAMMMALAESKERPVPLELLFTIDEEAGMTGAGGLEPEKLGIRSKMLINIDTEDDDEITIGAAGGRDATFSIGAKWESVTGLEFITIAVDGLKGGHSGVEINQGRANANRLLARALARLSRSMALRLVRFTGGSRRNAIPDHAQATLAVAANDAIKIASELDKFNEELARLYKARDNAAQWKIEKAAGQAGDQPALSVKATQAFIDMMNSIPTGICEMTPEIPVLVESSCNMAIIEAVDGKPIEIICSVRGTTRDAIEDICDSLRGVASLGNALLGDTKLRFGDGYPGWKPSLDAKLLKVAVEQYRKLFKAEPHVNAIHAGLECGLLIEKMPGLEAISIGPTIKGNHAVGERVQISSVAKSYRYVQAILESLA